MPSRAGRASASSRRIHLALPVIDLAALPAATREAEASRSPAGTSASSSTCARRRCCAPRVVRLGGEEHILLLTLHHILCDGWSLSLLLEEVVGAL